MGDADDDGRRAAACRGEPGFDVEGRAFAPAGEGGRGEEGIEGGCEFDAAAARVEAVDAEGADLVEGRGDDVFEEGGEVRGGASAVAAFSE